VSRHVQQAEEFLRDETITHLTCSNRVADAIQHQVMEHARGEVLTDVASGLRLIDSRVQLADNMSNQKKAC
jgi:hypothetical protein